DESMFLWMGLRSSFNHWLRSVVSSYIKRTTNTLDYGRNHQHSWLRSGVHGLRPRWFIVVDESMDLWMGLQLL
ncbi:2545_t:CDS:2, partial [Acaulospora morrowiae]